METLTKGYGLVEAPIWVPGSGLLFSDVLLGGVFQIGNDGSVSKVFAHRRGIGGMSLHENGGMMVSGRNISWKSIPEGDTVTVLDSDESVGRVGFNDITTDAAGRIYAGSLGASPVFEDGRTPKSGNLYLIDLDGSSQVVAEDIQLTNGLGLSPDGKVLYHSDSTPKHVNCYQVHADGTLGQKQIFATTQEGVPDGLAVSEDGRLWVALAGGSGVAVYRPDGTRDHFIEIPEPMCTSVCFGGEDLKDLYIVSGSAGADSETAGAVHRVAVDVAGLSVPLARVALPAS